MPANRTVRTRAPTVIFSYPVSVHLQLGDCLLSGEDEACGCGLRDKDGQFVVEAAAHLWKTHRKKVLKTWHRPYPCFAAVIFDQEKLPASPSPAWPENVRGEFKIVAEEVSAQRSGATFSRKIW